MSILLLQKSFSHREAEGLIFTGTARPLCQHSHKGSEADKNLQNLSSSSLPCNVLWRGLERALWEEPHKGTVVPLPQKKKKLLLRLLWCWKAHFGIVQQAQMNWQQKKPGCDCSAHLWIGSEGFWVAELGIYWDVKQERSGLPKRNWCLSYRETGHIKGSQRPWRAWRSFLHHPSRASAFLSSTQCRSDLILASPLRQNS